jgi:hypothetical protein
MGEAVGDPWQPFGDEQIEAVERGGSYLDQDLISGLDNWFRQLLYPEVLEPSGSHQSYGLHPWRSFRRMGSGSAPQGGSERRPVGFRAP